MSAPTSALLGGGRTVLVTGAAGFIGGALCQELVRSGWRVRALVRGPAPGLPRGVELVRAMDLQDGPALRAALRGADGVVHLAARVHIMRDTRSNALAVYRETNVEGTRALLAAARQVGTRSFVFISSVKAVGEATREPWTSATPPAPADPYGVSKLEAEDLVRQAVGGGLRASVLRLPVVYGPGMRANMLRLFTLVARGVPVPVGGIDNRRSFAYLGNVVAAIQAILLAPSACGTWFVSDGEDLSTADLVVRIGRALGKPARLLAPPLGALRVAGKVGDLVARFAPCPLTSGAVRRLTDSLVVDSTELSNAIGFSPPYSVEQGLELTSEWFRQSGAAR